MQNNKVLVGMSGGVDSSAAAILLKEQGYDVSGCMLKMHIPEGGVSKDAADAKAVADSLGIPFCVADYSDRFDNCVIKYFTDTYFEGKTPNPCVFCNKNMKFPCMLDAADKCGCHYIATGHYAKVSCRNGRYILERGADRKKDQSYMLYALGQDILSRVIFPLGSLTKEEIREYARKAGLSVADKKDSQDICFIKGTDYGTFIKDRTGITSPAGEFRDIDGKIIGTHKGIISYTVGQRKGLGISSEEPYYVVDKNVAQNTVVLGREKDLYATRVFAENVNFIPFDSLTQSMKVTAKLRYSQTDSVCTVSPTEKGFVLEFDTPQRAVTPGQSAVLYDGDTVIGGGVIVGTRE